jgi:hypothetical protein
MIMQCGEVIAVRDVPGCATPAFEGTRLQPCGKGLKRACESRNKDRKPASHFIGNKSRVPHIADFL